MEIYPQLLWRLLLYSFLSGLLLGALYDTLRLTRVLLGVCHYTDIACSACVVSPFRKRERTRKRPSLFRGILVAVQDLLFCFAVGALMMILLFYGNDGGFRGFVLLGLASGFLLYYATVGAFVVRVSEYVVFWLKTAMLYGVFYLTRPVVILACLLRRSAKRSCERLMLWRLQCYNEKKKKKLLEMSDAGFIGSDRIENGNYQTYRSKRDHKNGQKAVYRCKPPFAEKRVRAYHKRQERGNERHGVLGTRAS